MQPVRTIHEIRHDNFLRLLEELARDVGDRGALQALADRIDASHSQLSQLKTRARHSKTGRPRNIGDGMARRLESATGKPTGWMDADHSSQHVQQVERESLLRGLESHVTRLIAGEDAPLVTWEALVSENNRPALFRVAMPDNSMAPRLRAGQVARFCEELRPRPGDGVLVRDAAGQHYVRIYRQRRADAWEAYAENSAYQALDSERDGITVVAVLIGVDGRWS